MISCMVVGTNNICFLLLRNKTFWKLLGFMRKYWSNLLAVDKISIHWDTGAKGSILVRQTLNLMPIRLPVRCLPGSDFLSDADSDPTLELGQGIGKLKVNKKVLQQDSFKNFNSKLAPERLKLLAQMGNWTLVSRVRSNLTWIKPRAANFGYTRGGLSIIEVLWKWRVS